MLNQEALWQLFEQAGALLTGHFRLTSGLHSDRYIQCARVLMLPDQAEMLCRELVRRLDGRQVDVVVGPALGGVVLAYEMARQLGAAALFTERENGIMLLRRGFTLGAGQRVLVVEDVITTGGSAREVVELARQSGAEVVGVAALVDRSNGRVEMGVPLSALLAVEVASYEPQECPMCEAGIPVVKPGSRAV